MNAISKAIEHMVRKKQKEEHICPRCGNKMRENDIENPLSRHADVYICSDCGTDEAMRDFAKNVLPFHEWKVAKDLLANMDTVDGRKLFIDNIDSGVYDGTNVDGEMVIVDVVRGERMKISTIHKSKPRWWEVVEYNADGYEAAVSYEPVH